MYFIIRPDSKYFMLITGEIYPQRMFSSPGENFFSKVNSFSGRLLKLPWAIETSKKEVYSFFEGKPYLNVKILVVFVAVLTNHCTIILMVEPKFSLPEQTL